MRICRLSVMAVCLAAWLLPAASMAAAGHGGAVPAAEPKIVIAHRGASGYLPEHTLAAKAMAYAQGADYLEQDLVMTKDNALIVLHDHYLDRVTDVAARFPGRARKDGRYYAIDFTLAEIKSLKFSEGFDIKTTPSGSEHVQIYPKRFPMGKSDFHIHTFQEELEFIQGLNKSTGKNIGIYTEIKAPWFHKQEGRDISRAVLEALKHYGYAKKSDKAYLQCFDVRELQRIKTQLEPEMGMDLQLVQLIAYTDWQETMEQQADGTWRNYDYDWLFKPEAMAQVALYADAIGPDYHMLIAKDSRRGHIKLTPMAEAAHKAGLPIHPYTVRADALPPYAANTEELLAILFDKARIDGVFTDFPDFAVRFLQKQHQHQ